MLGRLQQGDPRAAEELLPLVYEELRRLAAAKMAREAPGQTLQPTALVHEAWLRLLGMDQTMWQNRSHFFCAVAEAMRRILIEQVRRKRALRHGGGQQRAELDTVEIAAPDSDARLLSVNEALERLSKHDPIKADVVKLRYFVGLTIKETAEALGVSEPTTKRHWTYARAWLYREIRANA